MSYMLTFFLHNTFVFFIDIQSVMNYYMYMPTKLYDKKTSKTLKIVMA